MTETEEKILKKDTIIMIKKFDNNTNKEFYDIGEHPDKAKIINVIEKNGCYKEIAVKIIEGELSENQIEFACFGNNEWRYLFEDQYSSERVYSKRGPYYKMEILNNEGEL